MKNYFVAKPRINKSNGQINISIPKKKVPKKLVEEIKCNPREMRFLWGDDVL